MGFDPYRVRARFPALRREIDGLPTVWVDGPAGTQVPERVIEAVGDVFARGVSNLGGDFEPSRDADHILAEARAAAADLFGARPGEIVIGPSMTGITLAMSRALSRDWGPGDAVVVTRLDHDANVSPWLIAAEERGAEVRFVDFLPDEGCRLDTESLRAALDERVRLVAVTAASNALGTTVDVRLVSALAHEVGALVYVDAVHYTPHGLVDVDVFDCDFLVASAYKFYGPHLGVLYGKREHLESFTPYKIRPAPDAAPMRWESGTLPFETIAGITAAIEHLIDTGAPEAEEGEPERDRRSLVAAAMAAIAEYERSLAARFLDGVAGIDGITVYGPPTTEGRVPTFAVDIAGMTPAEASRRLGEKGIFTWAGHYYALEVMDRLGRAEDGLLRIGFVNYNTAAEVDRVLEALSLLAAGRSLDESASFRPRPTLTDGLDPYVAYDMTGLPDPRVVPRRRLADGIVSIVEAEGPVTTDRLFQVFVKASGGKKVTRPVRLDLEWATSWLVDQGELVEERFTFEDETQSVVRRPEQPRVRLRELGDRDLYKVPMSEVAELVAIVQRRDQVTGEELKRAVLAEYGLKRLTDLADRYLDAVFRLAGI